MTKARPSFKRFLANPSSLRYATAAIISVSVMLVTVGAILIRIFDPDEYPTIGDALWFMLQTVTTVGYGDETPTNTIGRIVASLVMLISIGVITMVTAVITSLFIQSAGKSGNHSENDSTAESLARIEASLASRASSPVPPAANKALAP